MQQEISNHKLIKDQSTASVQQVSAGTLAVARELDKHHTAADCLEDMPQQGEPH